MIKSGMHIKNQVFSGEAGWGKILGAVLRTSLILGRRTFLSKTCRIDALVLFNIMFDNHFYTSTKSWRGYIFTAVCLCVCVSVCVCVRLFSCEQNSSQTDALIWTRFSLNGCLAHWLEPY